MTLALTGLTLSHFRSHRLSRIACDARPIALHGPNGAGKTNLLEAVSLLSPGRGLRHASAGEMARRPESLGWKVTATIEAGGTAIIANGGAEITNSGGVYGNIGVVVGGGVVDLMNTGTIIGETNAIVITNANGTLLLRNEGTIATLSGSLAAIKGLGNGDTLINSGTIEARSGTLQINAPGTHSGTVVAQSTATDPAAVVRAMETRRHE